LKDMIHTLILKERLLYKTEDRRQKTEDKRQKTKDRRQKTEDKRFIRRNFSQALKLLSGGVSGGGQNSNVKLRSNP